MKYTETHEWIKLENDIATIGITDHAQNELSDVVFVDLPSSGSIFKKGEVLLAIESVKAASDIYIPVAGEVVEVNQELDQSPELVNSSAEENGWLVKIKVDNPAEVDELMDKDAYEAIINQ